MPLCPATRLLPYCAVVLVACSSSAPKPKLYEPRELNQAEKAALEAQLKEADHAYRSGEGFERIRDQMAKDPVAACFLTRMLVLQVVNARGRREVGAVAMMRAAAGMRDPVETRAVEQITAMGTAAVPCIVEDLLKRPAADRRELGVELIGRIGAGALPELTPLLADRDARVRRTAARAVAALPASAQTRELLMRSAGDADFGVRGEALRGLDSGGPAEAALLRKALVQDGDPFARRSAAQALGGYRDPETARLLIDYLERCEREHELLGVDVAQASLQSLSDLRGKRTPQSWRSWLANWHPDQGR